MRSLALLHGLARCGGTVISRCLASMDNVVLLSEIHPLGPSFINARSPGAGMRFNAVAQAAAWYPFLFKTGDEDWIKQQAQADNSVEHLEAIAQRVNEKGMHLVVRTWPNMDFFSDPFGQQPSYRLQQRDDMARVFDIHEAFIQRHPITQYLSMINTGVAFARLKEPAGARGYLKGYRKFAELAARSKYIKYEDFIRAAQPAMTTLTHYLRVPYDAQFVNKWNQYNQITGDTKRMASDAIRKVNDYRLDPAMQRLFLDSEDYQTAIGLLDYPPVL
jgi:hypothetical protein